MSIKYGYKRITRKSLYFRKIKQRKTFNTIIEKREELMFSKR